MVLVSAFCLAGRLAEEGWRIVRSVRPAKALKLPSRPKKIAGMSMATTCHENVPMGSQFIDMSRRQQCRWAQISACRRGSDASPRSIPSTGKRCARSDPLGPADSSPPRRPVSHYAARWIFSRARLLSFSQELYRDFAILIGQFLKEEIQVGGIVEISASDRDLIVVMRRYFAAQAELESLKAQLEAARQAAGEAIGVSTIPARTPSTPPTCNARIA